MLVDLMTQHRRNVTHHEILVGGRRPHLRGEYLRTPVERSLLVRGDIQDLNAVIDVGQPQQPCFVPLNGRPVKENVIEQDKGFNDDK